MDPRHYHIGDTTAQKPRPQTQQKDDFFELLLGKNPKNKTVIMKSLIMSLI